ncbi:MAG: DUF4435 domain-containing protein [Bacteroidetes bacterium]|nr:DUF4435 domain-containing protein [Bacteroidota bacterium]
MIVEGDHDSRFFKDFIDAKFCKITIAYGKPNVLQAISTLDLKSFSGAIGVVDADLDHILGSRTSSENIVVTDSVDLEALLIRSPALDRVLLEFGSEDKIREFGNDVRHALVEAATWIGAMRLYSYNQNLDLKFKDIRYRKFIDPKVLSIKIHEFVQQVLNHSQRNDLDVDSIVEELISIRQSCVNHWHLCLGKDMIEILSLGLKSRLGTKRAQDVRPEMIKKYLRMSFHHNDFHCSSLSQDIIKWESMNPDYRVLKSYMNNPTPDSD